MLLQLQPVQRSSRSNAEARRRRVAQMEARRSDGQPQARWKKVGSQDSRLPRPQQATPESQATAKGGFGSWGLFQDAPWPSFGPRQPIASPRIRFGRRPATPLGGRPCWPWRLEWLVSRELALAPPWSRPGAKRRRGGEPNVVGTPSLPATRALLSSPPIRGHTACPPSSVASDQNQTAPPAQSSSLDGTWCG